jgi:hypothetical protein
MPAPIIVYWTLLGTAPLLALAISWLWWWLPKRVVARLALTEPKDRADVEDNYRKTIGQALGGIVVLLGAGLAYLQFLQQQQSSHDLLISNQVSKGFEQLGNKDAVVVRLGGIYALEGVMNNSDQYHQAVLEALSAFVREGAKLSTTPPPPGPPPPLPPDIQAALTVIGRRSAGQGIVDLTKANIAGADLREATLTGANLREATDRCRPIQRHPDRCRRPPVQRPPDPRQTDRRRPERRRPGRGQLDRHRPDRCRPDLRQPDWRQTGRHADRPEAIG